MNVIDFSATTTREPVKHVAALPNYIRMIIIGPSGSGKTQLLLNLIIRWMKWNKLYLVAPSVDDQRCYEVLKDFNDNATEITENNVIEFITDINDAPSIDDIDGSVNNLVVYDDVMLDNKKTLLEYFREEDIKHQCDIYHSTIHSDSKGNQGPL